MPGICSIFCSMFKPSPPEQKEFTTEELTGYIACELKKDGEPCTHIDVDGGEGEDVMGLTDGPLPSILIKFTLLSNTEPEFCRRVLRLQKEPRPFT